MVDRNRFEYMKSECVSEFCDKLNTLHELDWKNQLHSRNYEVVPTLLGSKFSSSLKIDFLGLILLLVIFPNSNVCNFPVSGSKHKRLPYNLEGRHENSALSNAYHSKLSSGYSRPAKDVWVVVGALIIIHILKLSDEY